MAMLGGAGTLIVPGTTVAIYVTDPATTGSAVTVKVPGPVTNAGPAFVRLPTTLPSGSVIVIAGLAPTGRPATATSIRFSGCVAPPDPPPPPPQPAIATLTTRIAQDRSSERPRSMTPPLNRVRRRLHGGANARKAGIRAGMLVAEHRFRNRGHGHPLAS